MFVAVATAAMNPRAQGIVIPAVRVMKRVEGQPEAGGFM